MTQQARLIIVATLATLTILAGCKSKQQAAAPSFAPWLQERLAQLNERYCTITLYELEGQPYYAIFSRGPEKSFDTNRLIVYDKDGNTCLTLGGLKRRTGKEDAFFEAATNKGIVWKSDAAREEDSRKQP